MKKTAGKYSDELQCPKTVQYSKCDQRGQRHIFKRCKQKQKIHIMTFKLGVLCIHMSLQ